MTTIIGHRLTLLSIKARKLVDFALQKLDSIFIKNIPSDDIKNLPRNYAYVFGTALFAVTLGVFLSLFVTGYMNEVGKTYLSAVVDSESDNCDPISVTNTGQYLASSGGDWEGQNGFSYSSAIYAITISGYTTSIANYQSVMTQLYYDLLAIGEINMKQDLATNLLYWFCFSALPVAGNNVQRFNLVGDPVVVFNREHIGGIISNEQGDCNITNSAYLDVAQNALTIQYNYHTFISHTICNQTVNPISQLGYRIGLKQDNFVISIDIRSLVTCLAISLNIINFDNLIEIPLTLRLFDIDGSGNSTESLFVADFYNPEYAGMKPLVCITSGRKEQRQCLLSINGGNLYAMPLFNHRGNNTALPYRCLCDDMTHAQKANQNDPCNIFQFLIGFLFYKDDKVNSLYQLFQTYHFNYTQINAKAFAASFTASYWGQESSYYTSVLNTPMHRNENYDFCRNTNKTCTIVMFSLFDDVHDWTVTSYYYQLTNGACQDSVTIPWDTW